MQPLPLPRYWAVAVPAYLLVGFVVFLLVYSGMNFLLVPNLDDPRNIKGGLVLVIMGSIMIKFCGTVACQSDM